MRGGGVMHQQAAMKAPPEKLSMYNMCSSGRGARGPPTIASRFLVKCCRIGVPRNGENIGWRVSGLWRKEG